MKQAYSLIELMVVITISTLLFTIGFPHFQDQIRNAHFRSFASQFTGHLVRARRHAQLAETSVTLDFAPTDAYRYRCYGGESDPESLMTSPWAAGYFSKIKNQLPRQSLPHPTSGRTIEKPLGSTHAPRVVFGPRGSSSGTLVFSDGESRALCVVVSGQTGRFKVFLWSKAANAWRVFY